MTLSNYYNLHRFSITLLLTILFSLCAFSQKKIKLDQETKVGLLSAACPGLGQFHNKKYWKIPAIYTALSGTLFQYINNNRKYKDYKAEYLSRINGDPNTINKFPNYTNNNLITLQEYHRNSRDLYGLLTLLIYVLNIVDASVDAHLANYNINNNLSLSLTSDDKSYNLINCTLKYNL